MKPKFLQAAPALRDRWMTSYVDMLTILLILFMAVAARNMPGVEPPAPNPLARVQQRLESEGLTAKLEPRGLVISLPQAILFASGDDQVSDAAQPMMEHIAAR